jgi:hypothetical protein
LFRSRWRIAFPAMPNGHAGDDWYTDIVSLGLPTLSPTADRLVAEVATLSGEPRHQPLISLVERHLDHIGYEELDSRTETVGMEWRSLTPDELAPLETELRSLRDQLRRKEVDELYQLPLGDFTSARNELAKRLKAAGLAEEAEEVKRLRKPTVAVWLANRLARERELDVQRLRTAGEALTKGQVEATAGRSSKAFLEARQDEHRALARLTEAAAEIAKREKLGAPTAHRAMETLRAASLTEEGRAVLKRGRLTEELQPPGFEALAGLIGVAPAPREAETARKDDRAEQRRALKEARERVKGLRAEERELAAAARTAAREAEEAQAKAADAAERVAEAESELERLG